jgi:hypothetical protein
MLLCKALTRAHSCEEDFDHMMKLYASSSRWLVIHESGTFVRFTQAGADLFA